MKPFVRCPFLLVVYRCYCRSFVGLVWGVEYSALVLYYNASNPFFDLQDYFVIF